METMQKVLLVLTIIGALNWGLVGLFDLNLVALLFGGASFMARMVYSIIAIAGIVNIGILFNNIEETN